MRQRVHGLQRVNVCLCADVSMRAHVCVRPGSADAGVAIDDRAVTTVTLRGIRKCPLNTNHIPPGT